MRSRNNKSVFYYTKDFENLPCSLFFATLLQVFYTHTKKMLVVRNEKEGKKIEWMRRRWCNNCSRTQTLIIIVKCHQIASFCFVTSESERTQVVLAPTNGEQLVWKWRKYKADIMIAGYEREMEIGKGCYCFKYIYNLFPSYVMPGFGRQTEKYTIKRHVNFIFFVLIKSFEMLLKERWRRRNQFKQKF